MSDDNNNTIDKARMILAMSVGALMTLGMLGAAIFEMVEWEVAGGWIFAGIEMIVLGAPKRK